MSSYTALGTAFRKAGIKPAEERLREIALKAMVAHADDMNATIEAIWREVQEDRRLLVALFEMEHRRTIGALLYRVRGDLHYGAQSGGLSRPVERKALKVAQAYRAERDREEAAERAADAARQAERDRKYREEMDQWRASRVGEIEINGQPIWETSVGTVRTWHQGQARKLRVVELLIQGLPEDGRPLGYYRSPGEVEGFWEQIALGYPR